MYETLEYMTLLAVVSLGGLVLLAVAIAMAAVQEGFAWLAKTAPRGFHHLTERKMLSAPSELKNSLPNAAPNTAAHSH